MAFGADHMVLLGRLDDAVQAAPKPTVELFSKLIAGACTRIPALGRSAVVTRIGRLVESSAWTEAAMALIELELPGWTLRRLVREDGEWFCSLSHEPNLPIMLDDTIDAVHETMPLAILLAFVRARREASLTAQARVSVPSLAPVEAADLICCENFV
jgi:hypothetical protein